MLFLLIQKIKKKSDESNSLSNSPQISPKKPSILSPLHITQKNRNPWLLRNRGINYILSSFDYQRLLNDCSNTAWMSFAFHALPCIIAQTGLFTWFSFMHCYVPICTIKTKFVAKLLQNCFFVANCGESTPRTLS